MESTATESNAQPAAAATEQTPLMNQQPAATGTHSQSQGYPPLPEPNLKGDAQGGAVSGYLRRRINEEQFDAFCIDCQDSRSSHCNVTFGTFICAQCAEVHLQHFSPFQSYIKPLFEDAWDTFQITLVQVGGNKRFFDFLREYNKERDPINKKYDSSAAQYYRRMLCAQAKNLPFNEQAPSRSAKEFANNALDTTGKFFVTTNEKYQISQKTSEAAATAKASISSLWGRSKTFFAKKGGAEGQATATESSDAGQAAIGEEAEEEAKAAQ